MHKLMYLVLFCLLGIGIYGFIIGSGPIDSDCYEKVERWSLYVKGKILAPAQKDGDLGIIRITHVHESESLALFKYEEWPKSEVNDVVYFKLLLLDGLPLAEEISDTKHPVEVFGGTAYTGLKWHSVDTDHSHNPLSIDPIHTKMHLMSVTNQGGEITWIVRPTGSNATNQLELKGGEEFLDEFGSMTNREVWVEYHIGNDDLIQIDTCHRHGSVVVDCL